MTFTRRHALALMSASAAAAACASPGADVPPLGTETAPLKDLAAAKGIRFGTAIAPQQLDDPKYVEIVLRDCAVIVADNAHKMYVIQPEPGELNFAPGDKLVAFAKANGLGMRGHTLLWQHSQWLPKWVNETQFANRAEAEALLGDYITKVASHDAGFIYSWDVVNETIDPETGDIRETSLTRAMGPEVIDFAFRIAHAAAPNATLAYNDYMSWEPSHETHRAGVLRLLERLKKHDVPIHALGIQSHSNDAPPSAFNATQQRLWQGFVDEVVGMGLDLYLTEFDVNDTQMEPGITQRDREMAAYTRDYLDMMLSYPQTKDLLIWGMVDNQNWLQGFKPREDGIEKRPTLYDSQYRPKLMRDAVASALKSAPDRLA